MNIKRAIFALAGLAVLLPTVASAQITPAEGTAVFIANKFFIDGNDETVVTLNLTCDSGLPLEQSKDVTWEIGWETAFVLGDIPLGGLAPDCVVDEEPVAGYETRYVCSKGPIIRPSDYDAAHQWGSEEPCGWDAVEAGDVYYALIVNLPMPVEVAVTKTWVVESDGGLPVDQEVKIKIMCDSKILEASEDGYDADYHKQVWKYKETIDGSDTVTVDVIPDFPSSNCWAEENVRNSAVETDNDGCDSMTISVGKGASCEFTNTVFYEGIPTLSQYGLAIMALLMLGVGFVGFRRFV